MFIRQCCKDTKSREKTGTCCQFSENILFKTTSKIVKDKSNRVGLHAKIAESPPVFCKDSTTSWRSQIFLSVGRVGVFRQSQRYG